MAAPISAALAELDELNKRSDARLVPLNDAQHRRACPACKIEPHKLVTLERAFIGWTTIPELAKQYGLSEDTISNHAAWYSLQLFRAANIRVAYAEHVVAGLEKRDDITPELGLRALVKLDELSTPAPVQPGDQGEPVSWERQVRLTVRGRAGADSRPTVGAGSDGQAGQPVTVDAMRVDHDWPEP